MRGSVIKGKCSSCVGAPVRGQLTVSHIAPHNGGVPSQAAILPRLPRRCSCWGGLLLCAVFAGCLMEEAPPRSRRAALGGDASVEIGCGPVTYVGCCAGETLAYCASGALQVEPCTSRAPCAWSVTHGLYRCGPGPASDPSGTAPRDCPAADGGPSLDAAVADAAPGGDGAVADAAPSSCGALTHEGCCTGDELLFCSAGAVLSLPCAPGTCGWNETFRYYDCDTAGIAGPQEFPHSCEVLLGDGGLPTGDAGQDASSDAVGVDDAAGDRGPARDGRPGSDAFIVGGDAQPRRDSRPDDSGPRDLRGLDAVGLESSVVDGGTGAGDGGCGCRTASAGRLPSLLLGVFALVAARRRGRGRGAALNPRRSARV